MNKTYIKFL